MKTFFLIGLASLSSLYAAATDDLARYDYGDNRQPLMEIQSTIEKADKAKRAELEKQFIALLERPDVPTGAKDAICRWLQVIGTPASIPALEKISADPKIGFLAAYALMSYPDPEANTALIRLLGTTTSPQLRAEVIGALGRRRSPESVSALAKINEPATWTALGAIGSPEAVAALQQIPPLKDPALDWAKLYGALKVLPSDRALAVSVFHSLLKSPARIGAVEGLIQARDPGVLAAVQQLLQEGNLAAVSLLGPFSSTLAADFEKWSPAIQRAAALSSDDMTLLQKGLASQDETVRTASIQSLGRSTDPGAVPVLLSLLNHEKDAAAATASLQKVRGTGADAALRAALKSPSQAAVLSILAARQDKESLAAAFEATQSSDEKIRASGFQALALLAGPDSLPKFLALLPAIKTPADRAAWNKTLQVMVQNSADTDSTAALLEDALKQAPPEVRPTLMTSLASLRSEKAKATLKNELHVDDLDQRKAVIRILSSVRNITSAELLLDAAKEAKDPTERMLALRGYLDSLRTRSDLSPDQLFEAYQVALTLASEQAEKDAIYAGIKGIKNSRQATEFLKKKPSA